MDKGSLLFLTEESVVLSYANKYLHLHWKPTRIITLPGNIACRLRYSGDQTYSESHGVIYMRLGRHYYRAQYK